MTNGQPNVPKPGPTAGDTSPARTNGPLPDLDPYAHEPGRTAFVGHLAIGLDGVILARILKLLECRARALEDRLRVETRRPLHGRGGLTLTDGGVDHDREDNSEQSHAQSGAPLPSHTYRITATLND